LPADKQFAAKSPRRFVIDVLSVPTVSEARLASVLDTAVDGIVLIDDKARILVFNKACERMFGYTAAEMLGRNVKAIMPEEFAPHHDGYVANYVRTGSNKVMGLDREVRGQHRDGTVFPLELSLGQTDTPEGRQFVGILRDLRQRQNTELRLNQLQADLVHLARVSAMDEMGAALAHELNQPLTAVMLYLQAIKRAHAADPNGGVLSPTALAIFDKALREAERAGKIIQRMRHFIEKREPRRRRLDLNPLIDDAVELTLLGSPPGTRIERSLAPDLPQVAVDPVQVQQIMVNLLRNAINAICDRENPEVRITSRRSGRVVEMSVTDNGPGIPADALPNLFSAFSSSKGDGLGLGLAISRTIAQTHGGDLTVDAGGANRGACFTLHLPVPASGQD
jgi:two-component system, LuxR family, sensor kinase FixL